MKSLKIILNIIKDSITPYSWILLPFLGFILLIYYIWVRFIRIRLPREIPFNLTLFSFILLVISCGFFIYILLRIIKPKIPNPVVYNLLLKISQIYIPLIALDKWIKKTSIVRKLYEKTIRFSIKLLNPYTLYPLDRASFLHIIFFATPNLVLALLLCIDVFFLYKIHLLYKFVILGAIPLIAKYFIYTIQQMKDEYILQLNHNYFIEILSQSNYEIDYLWDPKDISYDSHIEGPYETLYQYVYAHKFIKFQADAITWGHVPLEYRCVPLLEREDIILLSASSTYIESRKPLLSKEDFYLYLNLCIEIELILQANDLVSKWDLYKQFLIIITLLYSICWTYILFVSIHTLNWFDLLDLCIKSLPALEEPFSGVLFIYI